MVVAGWAALHADPPGVVAVAGEIYRISLDLARVLLPLGLASIIASALAVSRRMYIGTALLAGVVSLIAGVSNGLVGWPMLNLIVLAIMATARGAFWRVPPDITERAAPPAG
jgi:hypothetical protein